MRARLARLPGPARAGLALIAAALVAGAAWFGWWTLSPLVLDRVVSEGVLEPVAAPTADPPAPAPTGIAVLREGRFAGADAFHEVAGTVRVLDRGEDVIVRFEDDFASTNGPDLFVWLLEGDDPGEGVLDLGRLKGNRGAQNYLVPEGTDLSRYGRVVIWCRAFGVLFGGAPLG